MDCTLCLLILSQKNVFGCEFFMFGYFSHAFNFWRCFFYLVCFQKYYNLVGIVRVGYSFCVNLEENQVLSQNGVPLKNFKLKLDNS